jgi:hypothetical protein
MSDEKTVEERLADLYERIAKAQKDSGQAATKEFFDTALLLRARAAVARDFPKILEQLASAVESGLRQMEISYVNPMPEKDNSLVCIYNEVYCAEMWKKAAKRLRFSPCRRNGMIWFISVTW